MSSPTPIDQTSVTREPVYEPPVVLATFAKADLVKDLPENLTPHLHSVQNS